MKKLLLLFVLIDFVFVGLILKVNSSKNQRAISTVTETPFDDLSEGQKNKWNLITTLDFSTSDTALVLDSSKLQMICETSSLVELHFYAQNIAFAGLQPQISTTFSCDAVQKNQSQRQLITSFTDFKKMHKLKELKLADSQLTASQIYSDEEFPTDWKLAEIKITGANNFTINEYEIEKVLARTFSFTVPISVK